jgi:membrane protein
MYLDDRPSLPGRVVSTFGPTLRYLMQTEVHVYAFSVAANVLLSFFPFLIVSISLARVFFDQQTTVGAIDFALRDYFPDALGRFLYNNLPERRPVEFASMILLLFTANGVFEPLEVALNRVWGISKNRSFFRNQLVSLLLIFACGGLALLSLAATAVHRGSLNGLAVDAWLSRIVLRIVTVPLAALILFLVYRYLPNELPHGRPPLNRVVPAAVGVGVLLEAMKVLMALLWPWMDLRIAREYGVFRYSVTLIFLGFITSMLVLAGAEWSARGHRLDRPPAPAVTAPEPVKEGSVAI